MATTASILRRYPVTTLLGTSAAGATIAYYGYSRYNMSALQQRSPKSNNLFSTASAGETPKPKTTFPGGFKTLTLVSSEVVNHNVKKLRFQLPEGDAESGLLPISSLLTKFTAEGGWVPTLRPYTPIDKDEPGHVTFLIKKYPNGKASGFMHSLKPGETITARPIHELDYKPGQYSNLTIVAGGAGITPFIQIIRAVLNNHQDTTKISLVYSNSTDEDILLKSEFDNLASKQSDRFKVNYVVTKPSTFSTGVKTGHITQQILEQALPARQEWSKSKVLVCGPPPMVDAVAGAKGGFGWTQGSIGGLLKDIGLESSQVQKF